MNEIRHLLYITKFSKYSVFLVNEFQPYTIYIILSLVQTEDFTSSRRSTWVTQVDVWFLCSLSRLSFWCGHNILSQVAKESRSPCQRMISDVLSGDQKRWVNAWAGFPHPSPSSTYLLYPSSPGPCLDCSLDCLQSFHNLAAYNI